MSEVDLIAATFAKMEAEMAGYDDRDGFIWMDGKLVEWRDAKVHILTHALHYASAVFEGERCYNGKIFKSTEHSERLLMSGELLDMPIPYTAAQIDAAKVEVLKANGLTDAYVRAIAFRGAGDEMGVAALANPVRLAIACWTWGALRPKRFPRRPRRRVCI
jgi:branched-chain amino acid aminotransferase